MGHVHLAIRDAAGVQRALANEVVHGASVLVVQVDDLANAGLDQILAISVPVLNMLYPAAIVLIVLAFLPAPVQRLKGIYPWGIAFVGVASVAYEVRSLGQSIPALDRVLSRIPLSGAVDHLLEQIPLAGVGLGWVLPAVVGILLGAVISLMAGQKD